MKPRKRYPSDVSREQFERVRPLLEAVRRRTKPRLVDLHEVFNAVLYLLKSGCQWRMLPEGFPKWRTVHAYFSKWSEPGPNAAVLLFTPTSEAAVRAVEPDSKCSIKRLCTDHSNRLFRIWKPS